MRDWEMSKLEGEKKKGELVQLPYYYKFKKHFKEPCQEWLDTIEIMCNDILDNYSKKEDQLMTAAFGSRPKQRLNRVLDALNFDYHDYEQLGGDAGGPKRKRIASALDEESTKLAKKKKEISEKLSPEPKVAAPRKRKVASPKPKTLVREEEVPATPSAAEVEEILKVMTESLRVKLSPLAPELTKFFQKDKEASAAESHAKPKKRRIIQVTDVIHQTPPPVSASKIVIAETAEAEAAAAEATEAETTEVETAGAEATGAKTTGAEAGTTEDSNLNFGSRCVQRLKDVFYSIGASSEKFSPSAENLPSTLEYIEGEVDALDEVIAGHADFCALVASRGTATAFLKAGCTHGKIVNRPNFSLSAADLVDIPSLARSIGNRFMTQI
jgi:hypothetical protein